MNEIYFCPNCHLKIIPPKYLNQVNSVSGKIKLNCGNCNKDGKNKKGVVVIKQKAKQEDEKQV